MFWLRREFLIGLAAGVTCGLPASAARAAPTRFSSADVDRFARRLAAAPYRGPSTDLPADLAGIGYDGYRGLRPDRRRMFFPQSAIRLEPLPRGGPLYRDRIELHTVENGLATPIAFDPAAFSEVPREVRLPNDPAFGFSGFRLFGGLNRPDLLDEIAVFQGASYFRALGRGNGYGLSARGLGLGAGGPQEEFPLFRAFWIERPAGDQVRVHALLDGPSLAGVWHMDIAPGETTRFEIDARLYPRRAIHAACVAPMSSMFRAGAASQRRFDDYRTAVHDSDGLEIWTGAGERLWRPLGNPPHLAVSAFADDSPRGFGLMQRARDFATYRDAEARYELRPSLWVEPLERWGQGTVQLVEIPTENEFADNIVAFWRPIAPWPARREVRLRYRLHWGSPEVASNPPLRVGNVQTGARSAGDPNRFYAVDFEVGRGVGDWRSLQPIISASAGAVSEPRIEPLPDGRLRATFIFAPPPRGGIADLRLEVTRGTARIGETCLMRWPS